MSHLRHTSQKCSAPAEHFSHVIPPSLGSLNGNRLGEQGAKAIAAVLKDSQLSTLGCAATPNLHLAYTRQSPLTLSVNPAQSRKQQSGRRDGFREEE